MNSEINRLKSFTSWPEHLKSVTPSVLSNAGFFHAPTHEFNDRTKCFSCGIVLVGWAKEDDAMSEHRKHSPKCPYVQGSPCGNIPLTASAQHLSSNTATGAGRRLKDPSLSRSRSSLPSLSIKPQSPKPSILQKLDDGLRDSSDTGASEEDQEHRMRHSLMRSAFVQELVLSTLFADNNPLENPVWNPESGPKAS
mmetsp:Transcript_31101/g.50320  ORF Transcript_31101/g.50320 Transcript_31101/m.50320 type:complete len:195 (+) Transcript_31101:74-658(+)